MSSMKTKACRCDHDWDLHDPVIGCVAGWEWDETGLATTEGCECLATLARQAPR